MKQLHEHSITIKTKTELEGIEGLKWAAQDLRLKLLDLALALKTGGTELLLNMGDMNIVLHEFTDVPLIATETKKTATKAKKQEEPKEEVEEEKPEIKARDYKELQAEQQAELAAEQADEDDEDDSKSKKPAPAKKIELTNEAILDSIFENMKRTVKSEGIITALLDSEGPLEVKDIADACEMEATGVSQWFSTTASRIPAIEKTEHGFKFNRSKFKA